MDKDNEALIAMKPIVTNMGLDWKSQHTKLTEKFGSVMVELTTTGGNGKQYKMSCLPLRKLPAWLYSISPNKVKPELRDKIIRYQVECDDALCDYWNKGSAIRTCAPKVSQQIALSRHRVALLNLNTIGIGTPGVSEVANKLWSALEILDRKGERYNHAPWLRGMI